MTAKIENSKLGKLAYSRWNNTLCTEAFQRNGSHTAVTVQLHTGLVAPQIYILVKIPVTPFGVGYTRILPVGTIKCLPNLLKGYIILYILLGAFYIKGNLNIFCNLVIDHIKCSVGGVIHLAKLFLTLFIGIGSEAVHFICTCGEPQHRIALKIRSFGIMPGSCIVFEILYILGKQTTECGLFQCELVLHGYIYRLDIAKGKDLVILGSTCQGSNVLYNLERHLATGRNRHRERLGYQTTGNNREIAVIYIGREEFLLLAVIKSESNSLVVARNKFYFVAAQAILGSFGIIVVEQQGLCYGATGALQHNLHFMSVG